MGSIAVVDYGMGNLRSVAKALEHVAPDSRIQVTSDAAVIAAADRVVFPGVGAMPDCIRELEERNLEGLGILPGTVRRFPAEAMVDARGERLKVPHIGWNEVHQAVSHPLWQGITNGARFYFVHSYYVEA